MGDRKDKPVNVLAFCMPCKIICLLKVKIDCVEMSIWIGDMPF